MPGELFGSLMERLFDEGAIDVWYTPIYMKKNRPGIKVSVMAYKEQVDKLSEVLLRETTTLGVRINILSRRILNREFDSIETPYGIITMKISKGNDIYKAVPEYEDCRKAAIIRYLY